MQEIFDFNSIKNLLQGKGEFKKPFRILVDCMHGVTGPYAKKLFCDIFGAEPSSVLHATPLEDFGGGHPDPNLTYAGGLVQKLRNGEHDFGVAFDGDGDRNMVLGKNAFFVTPSDSLAVLCAHLHCIPYFQKHGIKGFARSMPTAAAIDKVGSATRVSVYEVPTGWKFFGNLLDAGLISVCGEESFGTGSSHIREKDGIWAALTWLSVIAHTNKCVEELLCDHWSTYGRNFTIRHDYEELDSAVANELMKKLEEKIGGLKDVSLVKEPVEYKVSLADNYSYSDLIDKSTVANQGIRILFHNESRIVFRLSGTGSSGATLRVYYEAYVKDVECTRYPREVVLAPLVAIADEVAQITKMTGRQQPTVIT
ncbi:hypothetical protein AAG570_004365 [Ranatra chinensis]|uniref:phosphoglucomutase (alpha-D-glucose-1,6-bisphosphate-dependent) n=1 Tax=Ranatra chinensis TaxID=642074 RepID=A0ABD0Y0M5_9HEMI